MLSRSSRTCFAAITVTAAALASAGCGTSHNGTTVSSASGSVTAARAIRLAATHAQRVTSFVENISVQTTGAYRMSLSGTIEEQRQPNSLVVIDYPSYGVPQQQAIPGGAEQIIDGNTVYMRGPGLSRRPGKPWVREHISGIGQPIGGLGLLFGQAQGDDLVVQAEMLANSADARKVGTATIDGAATIEYAGSYSTRLALEKLPAKVRAEVALQVQAMGLGPETFEVWLDAQQQVRQLITVQKADGVRTVTSSQVTSINQPITVTLPTASQTAPMPGA